MDGCGPTRPLTEAIPVWAGHSSQVKVYELQPAGKKRMTAEEFLRGYPIQDGCRFGPERLA